ncbi:UDP-glucuronosyltransferase 1-4 [Lingula anatina]|uniref:UDP-glucuronosyltransferase n=1 Tax=Lingula anatina TaxID=7574 RepID=A0A1S3JRG3_LINAN|nr:UDP-glucuronosyltransferase 1-4 [Lingula anatina]|eukprot:XP_013412569.1 UDP-glucuronosyltransferase 1-4 [Lingula anatina]
MATFHLIQHVVILSLVLLHVPMESDGEKILIFPCTHIFNSRTLNLEKISVMLRDHGHTVSMLVGDHYKPKMNVSGIELIVYKMPELWVNKGGELDLNTTMYYVEKDPMPFVKEIEKVDYMMAENLLEDQQLVKRLKAAGFSLLFVDMSNMAVNYFLREYLDIPSIAYNNFGFFDIWFYFNQPSFPSYMPYILTDFSDNMTFTERLQNLDFVIEAEEWANEKIETMDKLKQKYLPNENWPSARHTYQRMSLFIAANVNFAFDYPRPVMPHVKPISGLLWTPPKPLPKFYANIMASATQGVILMSFGTLVPTLPKDKAEILAKVFAKLPQKVIWRYKGVAPKFLGKNTYLVDWFPQNDLLAHPATKLFITHCGVSSTWETLYHAVPVVAMPLLWDQQHQARKLKERAKIGEIVVFSSLSEEALETAINKVLNDRSYKENAVRMSKLLQDTPMSGQEELLFWINYVIRHNGTLHFHSQATYRLNWYQYYLLDVIAYKLLVQCLYYAMYLSLGVISWKLLKKILTMFQGKKEKAH